MVRQGFRGADIDATAAVLFPMTGAMSVGQVTAPYANPNVFLFLGGFMIAVCMEKWNLHRRIALIIINLVGTSPNRLILGFMAAMAAAMAIHHTR